MIDPYYDVTYVPYSKISQNNNLHIMAERLSITANGAKLNEAIQAQLDDIKKAGTFKSAGRHQEGWNLQGGACDYQRAGR